METHCRPDGPSADQEVKQEGGWPGGPGDAFPLMASLWPGNWLLAAEGGCSRQ